MYNQARCLIYPSSYEGFGLPIVEAQKTGCPVIPVAISGTDDVFENSFPWIKKSTCVIEYGTPIYPDQLTKEERKGMGAYCRDIITEMLKGHESYLVNNPSQKKK